MTDINDFLAELSTLITTGFTVGDVDFLGDEIELKDFAADDTQFRVVTSEGALGNEYVGPLIFIHQYRPDYFRAIGTRWRQSDVLLDFYFTQGAYTKVVGATTLSSVELGRYIHEHISDALELIQGKFTTVSVHKLQVVPDTTQTGRIEGTDIVAGRIRFNVQYA